MNVSPKALRFDADRMWVDLSDGRTIGVPLAWFPRLFHASPEARDAYELSRRGIHWRDLDEDISVAVLLAGGGEQTQPERSEGNAAIEGAVELVRHGAQAATETAVDVVRSGADRLGASTTMAAERVGTLVRSGASGIAAGTAVAGDALTDFARNLDWSAVDPTRYLDVGTRGVGRSLEEARLVWESIPEQLRALGQGEVEIRLDGFDWSHIVPYSKGGGHEAANGIFEIASLNRSRAAEQMTSAEIEAAAGVLSGEAFAATLDEVTKQVATGASCGVVISLVIAVLEYGLEHQRGEITANEMYRRIHRDVARSAVAAAAVSGVITAVALAFPALIPLAAPLVTVLAAVAICAVGGKVYRLGKGWYELHRRIGVPLRDSGFIGNHQNP